MTEETTMNEEILGLLKALVDKVHQLEKDVYNKDNLLMKSGWVTVDSPKPVIANTQNEIGDIAKMDWDEISDMVAKIDKQGRGGY